LIWVLSKRVTDYIENELIPELKKQSPKADVITENTNQVVPLLPDDKSPAEQLIRHLTGLNASGVVSFGTEAGAVQRSGVPAVVFGPGSINQAHQPDEFIEIDQIGECIEFMYKLLDWTTKDDADNLLQ